MSLIVKLVMTLLVVTQLSFAAGKRTVAASNVATVIPEGSHLSHPHELLMGFGDTTQSATLSFNNSTRIIFGGAYYYRLNNFLQVGPRLSFGYINLGATSLTAMEFHGSARINFPFDGEFENTFFADALLGFGTRSSGTAVTTALLGFEAGKRFLLFPNFTWQPTAAVIIPTNGSYGAIEIVFRLLSASLVF